MMKSSVGGVLSFTWFPGLTRRRAASAQRWAALITSAFLPVSGFSWTQGASQFISISIVSGLQCSLTNYQTGITYLGHSDSEGVSHIWDEAINMHTQVTAHRQQRKTWDKACIRTITNLVHRMESRNRASYILTMSPSLSMTSGSLFRGEQWHTQLLTDTQVGKAIPEEERESERGSRGVRDALQLKTNEMQQIFYLSSCPSPSWRSFQSRPWWRHRLSHTGWAQRLQP